MTRRIIILSMVAITTIIKIIDRFMIYRTDNIGGILLFVNEIAQYISYIAMFIYILLDGNKHVKMTSELYPNPNPSIRRLVREEIKEFINND